MLKELQFCPKTMEICSKMFTQERCNKIYVLESMLFLKEKAQMRGKKIITS